MKDTDKKEIKIELIEDDKASITVRNICIDCVIEHLKKITKQLIKDRDRIAGAIEDDEYDEYDCSEVIEIDDAYSKYKKAKDMAEKTFAEYGVKADTIPDSFGKVLSIINSDEQIRDDMLKLLAGFVTNESFIEKDTKKNKKK